MLGLLAGSLYLGGGCLRATQAAAGDAPYQPGTPFTYLFDTGSQFTRPLSGRSLAAKAGWTLVPQDNTEHEFQGDAVLLNDRLVVVVRAKGLGAEVYSQTAGGLKSRAVVMAAPVRAVFGTGIRSVRIVENNPGAVTVEATFETDAAGPCSARFRLTTGQAILEMVPGEAADRLFVWCTPRYVVVPDFFGDDMVFSAAHCDLPRFGLPAENFFMSLIGGGDAILVCVWRSGKQQAYALPAGEGPQRVIRGCEIEGGKDKTLWVAFLDQADVWHERSVTAEDAKAPIVLDWKPPFEARWRADLPPLHCVAESWEFRGDGATEEAPLARRDYRAGWYYPCLFENGRAAVRLLPPEEGTPSADRYPGPILVYPIDRSRATPLAVLCPTDILRNTLGVGPCQYILQTEGLASETDPTPDNVMDRVEAQFRKKKEAESAEQIKKQLREMTDHVGQAQARINEYAAFMHELRAICAAEADNEAVRDSVQTLSHILDEENWAIDTSGEPAHVAKLADLIVALIGNDDPLPECERLSGEIRHVGASQDRTLSKCRMAVRWLRQQARMCAVRNPPGAELAREIEVRAEQFLQSK
jgi:hypothetical protein